jgi:hypothetical protein
MTWIPFNNPVFLQPERRAINNTQNNKAVRM